MLNVHRGGNIPALESLANARAWGRDVSNNTSSLYPGSWIMFVSGNGMARTNGRDRMKVFCFGLAAISLLAISGCADYSDVQANMAQALPPYHQTGTADLDTAQGIKQVQSATHNFGVRFAPFF